MSRHRHSSTVRKIEGNEMRKTRRLLVAAALVAAFTLAGETTASASVSQGGNLRCSGYYPTPTVRSNTTGYVTHAWYDDKTQNSMSQGWPSNGVHTSTGWANDSNYWNVLADTAILSAGGTCS